MSVATALEELDDRQLRPSHFQAIAHLMREITGINLTPGKESLVRSRLAPRLRALRIVSFDEYVALVQSTSGADELRRMIDVLTTNKTSFFREADHFRFLDDVVFSRAIVSGRAPRIWCAGCSTGEEPYSIAMLARELLPKDLTSSMRILATDISTRVLTQASRGQYREEIIGDLPPMYPSRHLIRDDAGSFRVSDDVRSMVCFARLNLMEDWPMRDQFDVILCRNVMIYFERTTQSSLVRRFTRMLAPGGHLFVGHSESLTGLDHDLRYVQPAVYVR
jgi:chemotaxis protein methyltransferase CheR